MRRAWLSGALNALEFFGLLEIILSFMDSIY